MTFDAHANFAYAAVVTAPVPATTGTSLTVTTGLGALFPAAPFNATVWPASTMPIAATAEIVRVTAIVGDVFTITRAQEGTSAITIGVGDQIANTITVKVITDIQSSVAGAALTKTDDTNVTLTLGGTPSLALLQAASVTVGWTGTLAAARLNANVVQGVTNDTNITGSIAAQNLTLGWTGTLAAARLNANVVQSVVNDTNVTGSIAAQALTLGWTGTLGVARGGTNIASYAVGDLLYASGTTTLSKLVIGSSTNVLTSSGTAPQWTAISALNIPAANVSSGTFGSAIPDTGIYSFPSQVGIGTAGVTNNQLRVAGSVTASGGVASSTQYSTTMVAAANNDILRLLNVNASNLTPGAFTGLQVKGINVVAFSVAAFTTPSAPIGIDIGVVTGKAGADTYALRLGIPVSGDNNYLIAASTVSLFNVTAAGAMTLGSTLAVTGAASNAIGATASSTTNLILAASVAGVSPLRIPHGTAPSSPVDGDIWTTTAGLYVRINGSTVGPLT